MNINNPYFQPDSYGYAPSNEGQQGGGWQGAVGNALGSFSTGYAQGEAGGSDLSIDPYAGLTGSAQGFASGGVIGAIAGGIGAQMGQFGKLNRNLKNLDLGVNTGQVDAYGRPIYSGSEIANINNTVEQIRDSEKTLKQAWDPGTRIFSGLFGSRKKLRRARRKAIRSVRDAQNNFNESQEAFNMRSQANQSYNNSFNSDARMYNLYNRNNPYS